MQHSVRTCTRGPTSGRPRPAVLRIGQARGRMARVAVASSGGPRAVDGICETRLVHRRLPLVMHASWHRPRTWDGVCEVLVVWRLLGLLPECSPPAPATEPAASMGEGVRRRPHGLRRLFARDETAAGGSLLQANSPLKRSGADGCRRGFGVARIAAASRRKHRPTDRPREAASWDLRGRCDNGG